MTDLEITKLCAEAVFGKAYVHDNSVWLHCSKALTFSEPRREVDRYVMRYDPLHNDAQKWALVDKFPSCMAAALRQWHSDLGRTLCECVAKMQQEKEKL